jgi:polyketide synthase PksM
MPVARADRVAEAFVERARDVVRVDEIEAEIVRITMQDVENKNGCTDELIVGLQQAFAAIERHAAYKVVILTGHGSYFATGGTKQGLVSIHEGDVDYNDTDFYKLPLLCKLPVIAAMQGHGLGAGWVMGMASDFPILSSERHYSVNFMRFGFTPGVGSTLIFPEKFGACLAQEMLFTAKTYRGAELENKGIGCRVLPSADVLPYALDLAKTLAESPREALIELKRHMAEPLVARLDATIAKELRMHAKTFVNQPEVRARIEEMPGQAVWREATGVARDPRAADVGRLQSNAREASTDFAGTTMRPGANGVAVVGMSARFAQARDVHEFWQNIEHGTDCVQEVPAARWDWREFCENPHDETASVGVRWGAFIDGLDEFDPLFFGISPREAAEMPIAQRLLMSHVWSAIEDGGITADMLTRDPTGVFLALGPADGSPTTMASLVPSTLPNRISYVLNLRGPSEYCESGCVSFALALHRAIQSINGGECVQAIVAAVHLLESPTGFAAIDAIGLLSTNGKSRSFQADANGYVRGEGVGAVIVKTLDKAIADGDVIHAVVRGSGVAHGGSGMSLTTPSTEGMKTAMAHAFRTARVSPSSVSYIEAHGTASALSDAIEVNALVSGYAQAAREHEGHGAAEAPCVIGCLKSSIGHTEIASGLAALIKVILAMRHGVLPGIPGFRDPNDQMDVENTRFLFTAENRHWQRLADSHGRTLPRRAGINSYGYTGVNAHVLVEEFDPPPSRADLVPNDAVQIVVLSARSADRLPEMARRLVRFLDGLEHASTAELNLPNIAYTLQVGRVARDHRVALVVRNLEELVDGLDAYLAMMELPHAGNGGGNGSEAEHDSLGEPVAEHPTARIPIYCGSKSVQPAGRPHDWQAALAARDFEKLAYLWTCAVDIPWQKLHAGRTPRRISLPTYPFAGQAYEVLPSVAPIQRTNGAQSGAQRNGAAAPRDGFESEFRDFVVATLSRELNLKEHYITPDENFRAYGADSYVMANLVQAIEQRFAIVLTMRNIVEHMTLRSLAAFVVGKNSGVGVAARAQSSALDATMAAARAQDPRVIEALEKVAQGQMSLDEVDTLISILQREASP